MSAESVTMVQVLRGDLARIKAMKVHEKQPTREIVTEALDALERERNRAKQPQQRKSA